MMFSWLTLVWVVAVRADSRESPRTFCGRTLADARTLYCMGSEDAAMRKREVPDLIKESEMYQEKPGLFPFSDEDHHDPQASLRARGKRVPGLVDECCLKPCYINELLNYC